MKRFSKPMGIIIAFVFYNLAAANDELKHPDKRGLLVFNFESKLLNRKSYKTTIYELMPFV